MLKDVSKQSKGLCCLTAYNLLAKSYVVRPLIEYFWNTKQTEIFLNSYQQKHAFSELKDFEEKLLGYGGQK